MTDDCPETLTPCGRCQNLMRRHEAACPSCAAATAYRQSRQRMVAAPITGTIASAQRK
ncbi:MAG: hypothetical protein HOO96_14110 [Polyangiaceae bacterium]|nr:hypothetical protein [Polyangiaceae bacterium]